MKKDKETDLVSTAVKLLVYKGMTHGLLKKHFFLYCPVLMLLHTQVKAQQATAVLCPVVRHCLSVCALRLSLQPLPRSLVPWGWLAPPGDSATKVSSRGWVTPTANAPESAQASAQPGQCPPSYILQGTHFTGRKIGEKIQKYCRKWFKTSLELLW